METLLPIAEQLDRAAVELLLDHPIHNRLAIILVDNAVELMARQAIAVHLGIGSDFVGITSKHRKLARSQNIRDRLFVLTFVGEVTKLEAEFILAAHDERNAAYHEGPAEDAYLRELAICYFKFACNYLARFSKAFYSWSSAFEFTDIGRRYYDASRDADALLGKMDRRKLALLLLEQLPPSGPATLQELLADDLERDRNGVVQGLRFLIENTFPSQPTSFLIGKAQFDWARDLALSKNGLDQTVFDTPRRKEAVLFAKRNREKFEPRYRAIPHGNWAQAIRRVRSSSDPYSAMVLFHKTRKRMAFLRDAIGYSAELLEIKLERD